MIVGRAAEQTVLARMIEEARGGQAATVSLIGPPGIGKTALIEDSCARVAADYTIWRIRGVPADQSVAYAAVQPLLRQLRPNWESITTRQRTAMSHALGAGEGGPGVGDLLALGSGVLELLGEVARQSPILLAIDDAQWLDADSRELLGFVTRRLGSERVAVLAAAHAIDELPDSTGLVLELSDLPPFDAESVVRDLRPNASSATVDRLFELSGGNPLALHELLNQLPADESELLVFGTETQVLSLRAVSIFAPRISALSAEGQTALLVAACEGRVDKLAVLESLGLLGIDRAALGEVLDARLLVDADGLLSLQHPLVAAAVQASTSSKEVREAHGALADALAKSDSERSLWHRAASVAVTDESVALDLLAFALQAQERASYETATRAAELAARVAASTRTRVDALTLAAEMAFARGDLRQSEGLVARTRDLGDLPDEIDARCLLTSARIAIRRGSAAVGTSAFLAACLRLPVDNREALLREVLSYAVTEIETAQMAAVLGSPGAEALDGYTRRLVEAYMPIATQAASPPVGTVDLISSILDELPDDADHLTAEIAGNVAVQLGRYVQARRLYSRAVASSRQSSDIIGLATNTSGMAFVEAALGRWNRAYGLGLEVLDLVDERMMPGVFADMLPLLAEIDAARGRESARQWCKRARLLGEDIERPDLVVLAQRREGLLDLGLGSLDSAEHRFRAALEEADENGIVHPFYRASPDLVEVLLRQGRRDDAVDEATSFLELIGPGASDPPLARALRVQGMISEGGFDGYFRESLEIDDRIGLAFQAARTRLLYGERLRRERRRSDARAVLRVALDAFVALDAAPWVARTGAELAATGGAAAVRSGPAVAELLTPQEMQVATLVADGRRNREIAEQLFMSERTVESHLSRAYRKLGVANRTQLSRLVSGDATHGSG